MSFAAAGSRFAWVRPFCRQSPCLTQPGELGSSKLTKRYKPVRLRNCIGRDRTNTDKSIIWLSEQITED